MRRVQRATLVLRTPPPSLSPLVACPACARELSPRASRSWLGRR